MMNREVTSAAFASLVILMLSGSQAMVAEDRPLGVLLAAGDITGCDQSEIENAHATAAILGREIEALRRKGTPVKVVILGDLAYDDGSPQEFKCFQKTWGAVLNGKLAAPDSDVLPVPGNHEYGTENAEGYFKTFKSNLWVNQRPNGYFSLAFPEGKVAAWRLIGMNSEIGSDEAQEQTNWLTETLVQSRETCVLAFWHRPVFSSGHHGHEGSESDEPLKQEIMSEDEALLTKQGASIVLNGHDHNYEELLPHDEAGRPSETGLRSFIVGTGGRKLRDPEGEQWPDISAVFDTAHHGVLRLALYPGRYSWRFVSTQARAEADYGGEGSCNPRKASEQTQ